MDNNVNQDTYASIITSVVSVAATRVAGVASISNESGSSMNKLRFKNKNKSIEVEITAANQVVITLSCNIHFGYKVPEVAAELQETIRLEVESTTNYKIKSININIVGVVFPT